MTGHHTFDLQTILDGLGQGVLIFGNDGRLILDNLAARTFFGVALHSIRDGGWSAVAQSFDASGDLTSEQVLDIYRDDALQSERPIRFSMLRGGEQIPCWVAAVLSESGEVCTMFTIDSPDWTAMSALMTMFRGELNEAIDSTSGHIDIIEKDIAHFNKTLHKDFNKLTKRVTGLTGLVSIHMTRVSRLMKLIERMENIRTGVVYEKVKNARKRVKLEDFFEDFVEEIDDADLVDPETDAHAHRSRLTLDIKPDAIADVPPGYLTRILHDILRNAIMYSMKATPIKVSASADDKTVKIDIVDEGYGIRERERERIFEPFQRARQPQVFSEFGYGLSLYLCQQEVKAMNGDIQFQSEEGKGTTFTLTLPLWREAAAVSSSDSESATNP